MGTVRLIVRQERVAEDTREALVDDEFIIEGLVRRAASGDCDAFGEIYGRYLDRIYRYILYQVGDGMTAEDLTEEVFLKAWKALKNYRGHGKAFPSWLYRIAHNHVIDHWRSRARQESPYTDAMVSVDGPEEEAEKRELQAELAQALSHLPAEQAQVIVLKFIEGLETSEVARIMKKSQGAVRIMQMRALANLRQRLCGRDIGEWTESYQRS